MKKSLLVKPTIFGRQDRRQERRNENMENMLNNKPNQRMNENEKWELNGVVVSSL